MKLEQILPPQAKAGLDVMAAIGWISALAGTLTPIIGLVTALASLAWVLIRLYETKTVKGWFKR
jgi:hypothetical protein